MGACTGFAPPSPSRDQLTKTNGTKCKDSITPVDYKAVWVGYAIVYISSNWWQAKFLQPPEVEKALLRLLHDAVCVGGPIQFVILQNDSASQVPSKIRISAVSSLYTGISLGWSLNNVCNLSGITSERPGLQMSLFGFENNNVMLVWVLVIFPWVPSSVCHGCGLIPSVI